MAVSEYLPLHSAKHRTAPWHLWRGLSRLDQAVLGAIRSGKTEVPYALARLVRRKGHL